ncbi:MAG: Crp/Fnr family transcriptional regulator [Prolixibacteraceae bacterium]|nr:Crp/Fnr family transcriptional regulator [Prolixibacteraceae bacterium]
MNMIAMEPRRIEEACSKCKDRCCTKCFDEGEDSIFNTLTNDELELLVKEKRHVHFNAGETILKQNTSASHVVCIKRGLAKIIAEGEGDKKLILRLVATQSIITGGGIFMDEIRHFTVQAVTAVECCFIDSDKIYELVSNNSRFAFELLKMNNRQNIQMLNNLVGITQKYMPGRVADLLLYLKNEIFLCNPFDTRLSRQELADMTGMTMESFIRILKEFKTSGIISVDGSQIQILDEDALSLISRKG